MFPPWAFNSLQTAVFVFAYVRLQVNDCAVDFGKMAPPPLIHGVSIADVLRRTDGGTEERPLISDLLILMLRAA